MRWNNNLKCRRKKSWIENVFKTIFCFYFIYFVQAYTFIWEILVWLTFTTFQIILLLSMEAVVLRRKKNKQKIEIISNVINCKNLKTRHQIFTPLNYCTGLKNNFALSLSLSLYFSCIYIFVLEYYLFVSIFQWVYLHCTNVCWPCLSDTHPLCIYRWDLMVIMFEFIPWCISNRVNF